MSCGRDNCTASNKFGIFLVVLYIVYLSIGAAVFQALETPKELQKCDAARKSVLDKVDMLGNEFGAQLRLMAAERGAIEVNFVRFALPLEMS
ncbi:Oidioi.mRNA.OKI2018_I69.XSR.g14529.t1.cds [Oikopleura dioica]|uniref:Oidioi.mRNA.OKI2018_I69.XSR.g14529.t1.cds n=1 Tax=Oikopleura dioica TaxID=34765 RepID=A0ABN7SGD6_OIKDI|nr:Oidioi.mRNA.OKI2018_I69.XSR.g14529.t1.cds [Oikopleura dioica]